MEQYYGKKLENPDETLTLLVLGEHSQKPHTGSDQELWSPEAAEIPAAPLRSPVLYTKK